MENQPKQTKENLEEPKESEMAALEDKIQELVKKIQTAQSPEEKEKYFLEMGDLRYKHHLDCGMAVPSRQLNLAKNCYLAASKYRLRKA